MFNTVDSLYEKIQLYFTKWFLLCFCWEMRMNASVTIQKSLHQMIHMELSGIFRNDSILISFSCRRRIKNIYREVWQKCYNFESQIKAIIYYTICLVLHGHICAQCSFSMLLWKWTTGFAGTHFLLLSIYLPLLLFKVAHIQCQCWPKWT